LPEGSATCWIAPPPPPPEDVKFPPCSDDEDGPSDLAEPVPPFPIIWPYVEDPEEEQENLNDSEELDDSETNFYQPPGGRLPTVVLDESSSCYSYSRSPSPAELLVGSVAPAGC